MGIAAAEGSRYFNDRYPPNRQHRFARAVDRNKKPVYHFGKKGKKHHRKMGIKTMYCLILKRHICLDIYNIKKKDNFRMFSLYHYFAKGIGLSILALAFALLAYAVIKCLPACSVKKLASPKYLIILWYGLTLEAVSLLKTTEGVWLPLRQCNTQLFAWVENCFSDGITSLWQILLNFAAYIPLGAILATLFEGKKRAYLRIPLLIVCISAANELIQYVFALGITDIDDLLANTLGGLWGCSLYCLWEKIRDKKTPNTGTLLSAGLPLVLICTAVILYNIRPYGYMKEEFNFAGVRVKAVDCTAIENELSDPVTVYEFAKLGSEQRQNGAQKVFAALHQELDLTTRDAYDTVTVYRGAVPTYYIWYWNNGFFDLHTSNVGIALDETGLSPEQQILGLLAEMGVVLPEGAELAQETRGGYEMYTLSYAFAEAEGHSYYGSVSWEIEDNVLYDLSYKVLDLTAIGSFPGKDQESLCKQIKNGYFSSKDLQEKSVDVLTCISCDMQYVEDSKGFYRPVYLMQCIADGQSVEIITAA